MGRRKVIAVGPALSRLCVGNPYQPISSEELPKRSWSWRRKKSLQLGGGKKPRRRVGIKVGRLRIRFLSPIFLLRKLRDAYVRMMLSLDAKSGNCAGLVMANVPIYPMHMPGRMGF